MNKRRLVAGLALVGFVGVMVFALAGGAGAQGGGGADPVGALYRQATIEAQATRNAAASMPGVSAAQSDTARLEAQLAAARARQAQLAAQATQQARADLAYRQSAQATSNAALLAATVQAQATAGALAAQATQRAIIDAQRASDATATAQAQEAVVQATSQAQVIEATATRAALVARQEKARADLVTTWATWATWAGLAVGLCIVGYAGYKIAGTLGAWADRLRPAPRLVFSELAALVGSVRRPRPTGPVVIDAGGPVASGDFIQSVQDAPKQADGRMPGIVTIVDNPAMVAALDEWAARYDAAQAAAQGSEL